jgi:hypothetical protein
MRRLIVSGLVLLVLLGGALLLAVSNLNAYLEENRDRLSGMVSEAVGRQVAFERAEVAFSGGIAVRVSGLRIADDPAYGSLDFLALDQAYVGVRLLPALWGRIEVRGIRLDAPTIRVIQTAQGFNFDSLGGAPSAPVTPKAPSGEDASDSDSDSESDAGAGAVPAVVIAAFEIVEGTLTYEDRTGPDGLSLVIEDFETSGNDLSLTGPISIAFGGRIRSAKPADVGLESRFDGTVELVSVESQQGGVTLRSPALHPGIFGVRLEEGGEVERIQDLAIDVVLPEGLTRTGVPVNIRSSRARLAGLDLSQLILDVVYRDSRRGAEVGVRQASVGLAGGTVEATGDVVLGRPGASPFDLETKVRALDAGTLATALMGAPAGSLTGTLGGDVQLAGDGLDWGSLERSLTGKLRLAIGEGALERTNLLNTLAQSLTKDPGLGSLLAQSLREAAPEALSGDRTSFEGVDMALDILNGVVRAKDLSLSAEDFSLQAAGQVRLDGAVAADGTIELSADLSRAILSKADALAPFLADGDRVTLPLRFGGTTASPSIAPDLSALAGKAEEALRDRAAKELTDRLFGGAKKGDERDPDRESAEGMIKEGLGRLLGR